MTLPFFSVPTQFKRRTLVRVMGTGIWSALVLILPTSVLAQAVNPMQGRNAAAAGQVTVLPDASTKTSNAAQGNQNLSLPPALTAPVSSGVPAFSNFSSPPPRRQLWPQYGFNAPLSRSGV